MYWTHMDARMCGEILFKLIVQCILFFWNALICIFIYLSKTCYFYSFFRIVFVSLHKRNIGKIISLSEYKFCLVNLTNKVQQIHLLVNQLISYILHRLRYTCNLLYFVSCNLYKYFNDYLKVFIKNEIYLCMHVFIIIMTPSNWWLLMNN